MSARIQADGGQEMHQVAERSCSEAGEAFEAVKGTVNNVGSAREQRQDKWIMIKHHARQYHVACTT